MSIVKQEGDLCRRPGQVLCSREAKLCVGQGFSDPIAVTLPRVEEMACTQWVTTCKFRSILSSQVSMEPSNYMRPR